MRKNFLLATILSLGISLGSLVSASPIMAASPSPTPKASPKATPSPSPSPEASPTSPTQKLKERIDRVLEQRKDQVKGVVDQITNNKRGFIGEVQRVTEKTLTVRTNKGSQILTVDSSVVIMRDTKRISLDDIAVSDWVIAMGYMDKEEFLLRRLVVSSTSLRPRRYDTTIGTLTTIKKTQLTFTPRSSKDPLVVTTTKNTQYQDGQGNKIDAKNLQTDAQYLVISYEENGQKIPLLIRSLADNSN